MGSRISDPFFLRIAVRPQLTGHLGDANFALNGDLKDESSRIGDDVDLDRFAFAHQSGHPDSLRPYREKPKKIPWRVR
jgi:hypothetical protein